MSYNKDLLCQCVYAYACVRACVLDLQVASESSEEVKDPFQGRHFCLSDHLMTRHQMRPYLILGELKVQFCFSLRVRS